MQKYKIKLTTLSPVHIGDGETKNKIEFLYESSESKIYYFDFKNIYDFLVEKGGSYLTNFRRMLEGTNSNGETKINLNKFFENNSIELSEIKEKATSNHFTDVDFRERSAIWQIHSHIKTLLKTQNGLEKTAYIPGSSVKGAIKTAVIWDSLKRNPEKRKSFIQALNKFYDENEESIKIGIDSLNNAWETQAEKKYQARKHGEKFKVELRLTQNFPIRAFAQDKRELSLENEEEKVRENLRRDRNFPDSKIDEVIEKVKNYRKNVKWPLVEIVKNSQKEWESKIKIPKIPAKLEKLDNQLQELVFGSEKELNFMRLLQVSDFMPEKQVEFTVQSIDFFNLGEQKEILSTSHEVVSKNENFYSSEKFENESQMFFQNQSVKEFFTNKEKLFGEWKDFELTKAIFEHTNDLLEFEIERASKSRNAKYILEHLKEVKTKNSESQPVLRLGKAQGFISLTVGLLFLEHFKKEVENYQCLRKMLIALQGDGKNYPSSEFWPRILRICEKQTLGWVQISLDREFEQRKKSLEAKRQKEEEQKKKKANFLEGDPFEAIVESKKDNKNYWLKLPLEIQGKTEGILEAKNLEIGSKIKVKYKEKNFLGEVILEVVK